MGAFFAPNGVEGSAVQLALIYREFQRQDTRVAGQRMRLFISNVSSTGFPVRQPALVLQKEYHRHQQHHEHDDDEDQQQWDELL